MDDHPPECSHPECDKQMHATVRFEDMTTAHYCGDHAEYAVDEYDDAEAATIYPEEMWDEGKALCSNLICTNLVDVPDDHDRGDGWILCDSCEGGAA